MCGAMSVLTQVSRNPRINGCYIILQLVTPDNLFIVRELANLCPCSGQKDDDTHKQDDKPRIGVSIPVSVLYFADMCTGLRIIT